MPTTPEVIKTPILNKPDKAVYIWIDQSHTASMYVPRINLSIIRSLYPNLELRDGPEND